MGSVDLDYAKLFVGGRAYYERRAPGLSGVVASGNTLQIKLTRPVPGFLEEFADRAFCALGPGNERKGRPRRPVLAAL
jgi:hypothetical protein